MQSEAILVIFLDLSYQPWFPCEIIISLWNCIYGWYAWKQIFDRLQSSFTPLNTYWSIHQVANTGQGKQHIHMFYSSLWSKLKRNGQSFVTCTSPYRPVIIESFIISQKKFDMNKSFNIVGSHPPLAQDCTIIRLKIKKKNCINYYDWCIGLCYKAVNGETSWQVHITSIHSFFYFQN